MILHLILAGQRGKVMELVFDGLGNITSVIVALEREGKINEKDIVLEKSIKVVV